MATPNEGVGTVSDNTHSERLRALSIDETRGLLAFLESRFSDVEFYFGLQNCLSSDEMLKIRSTADDLIDLSLNAEVGKEMLKAANKRDEILTCNRIDALTDSMLGLLQRFSTEDLVRA